MTRTKILIVISALIVLGCAEMPDPEAQVRNVERRQLVCEMETPTGSHMPKRVCRYQSDIENDQRAVDILAERMQRNAPVRERKPGGNL